MRLCKKCRGDRYAPLGICSIIFSEIIVREVSLRHPDLSIQQAKSKLPYDYSLYELVPALERRAYDGMRSYTADAPHT
jgi:hypothetical protein